MGLRSELAAKVGELLTKRGKKLPDNLKEQIAGKPGRPRLAAKEKVAVSAETAKTARKLFRELSGKVRGGNVECTV